MESDLKTDQLDHSADDGGRSSFYHGQSLESCDISTPGASSMAQTLEDQNMEGSETPYPGWVFFMNHIEGCENDVNKLSKRFQSCGYKCKTLESDSKDNFIDVLEKCKPSGPVVIFFFGYGYKDFLFIDKQCNESFSYRVFCEKINNVRREENPTVVFTNICFKRKSQNTKTESLTNEILRDTFHISVKVNGKNTSGSVLTEAVLEETQSNHSQEFSDFARCVVCKIEELKKNKEDKYYASINYYGVKKIIKFPLKEFVYIEVVIRNKLLSKLKTTTKDDAINSSIFSVPLKLEIADSVSFVKRSHVAYDFDKIKEITPFNNDAEVVNIAEDVVAGKTTTLYSHQFKNTDSDNLPTYLQSTFPEEIQEYGYSFVERTILRSCCLKVCDEHEWNEKLTIDLKELLGLNCKEKVGIATTRPEKVKEFEQSICQMKRPLMKLFIKKGLEEEEEKKRIHNLTKELIQDDTNRKEITKELTEVFQEMNQEKKEELSDPLHFNFFVQEYIQRPNERKILITDSMFYLNIHKVNMERLSDKLEDVHEMDKLYCKKSLQRYFDHSNVLNEDDVEEFRERISCLGLNFEKLMSILFISSGDSQKIYFYRSEKEKQLSAALFICREIYKKKIKPEKKKVKKENMILNIIRNEVQDNSFKKKYGKMKSLITSISFILFHSDRDVLYSVINDIVEIFRVQHPLILINSILDLLVETACDVHVLQEFVNIIQPESTKQEVAISQQSIKTILPVIPMIQGWTIKLNFDRKDTRNLQNKKQDIDTLSKSILKNNVKLDVHATVKFRNLNNLSSHLAYFVCLTHLDLSIEDDGSCDPDSLSQLPFPDTLQYHHVMLILGTHSGWKRAACIVNSLYPQNLEEVNARSSLTIEDGPYPNQQELRRFFDFLKIQHFCRLRIHWIDDFQPPSGWVNALQDVCLTREITNDLQLYGPELLASSMGPVLSTSTMLNKETEEYGRHEEHSLMGSFPSTSTSISSGNEDKSLLESIKSDGPSTSKFKSISSGDDDKAMQEQRRRERGRVLAKEHWRKNILQEEALNEELRRFREEDLKMDEIYKKYKLSHEISPEER